jgi:arginyl-tRNA synthetase
MDKKPSQFTLDELLALYVKFHEEAEKDPTLEEQGRATFAKLEAGDKKLRAFWKDILSVTKASLADLYTRLHVSFDLDISESFYEDKMAPVLEEGKKKGVFTVGKEGALIVEFPEELNMPPYLVLKGDGATLYSTRDIAQMRYRIDIYHPQAIYIVTDIAQQLHFQQLVETCKRLQWELPAFENILFGRMRFADKSMSTRKGNILKLEEVLDEAVKRAAAIIQERGEAIQTDDPKELAEMMGIGALVYGILSQNRKMDIVFDWDKMLSFEGNSAPYLQYTHARAKSVLRKAGQSDAALPSTTNAFTAHERNLATTLLQFECVLAAARAEHLPHKIANYLYALCQDFNAFYNTDPILTATGATRDVRLSLTALTAGVLKTGAELLTMRVPERM